MCSLLNRMFSTKLTLRRHMGIHRGEKPFSCPHCPYSSRLKSSLLQHLRTHTGNYAHWGIPPPGEAHTCPSVT